MPDIRVVG